MHTAVISNLRLCLNQYTAVPSVIYITYNPGLKRNSLSKHTHRQKCDRKAIFLLLLQMMLCYKNNYVYGDWGDVQW